MKSHIQIPKCILKAFAQDNNAYFMYDVNANKIRRGHPKTTLTEEDYYSEHMEYLLCQKVENPLCKMLDFSKQTILMDPSVLVDSDILDISLTYAKSVIARSPSLCRGVFDHSLYSQFVSQQCRHDIVVAYAMTDSLLDNFFACYDRSFIVNQTESPFVLPTRGIYDCRLNDVSCLVVPIQPHCAILFKEKDKHILNITSSNNVIVILPIGFDDYVMKLNSFAFLRQNQEHDGYVVCHRKEILESLSIQVRSSAPRKSKGEHNDVGL